MTQHQSVADQVIDIVRRAHVCDLEEVTRQCPDLTWNQVFLAIDSMSRSGEIVLMPTGRGKYAVTFPQGREGRPVGPSLPF
jgi:hypothetical protein